MAAITKSYTTKEAILTALPLSYDRIIDNGVSIWKVNIENDGIKIYRNRDVSKGKNSLVHEFKDFEGYWVGHDNEKCRHGNTILIKLNSSDYAYIGDIIYLFTPEENIVDYYSPVGRNDVPYPLVVGENHVFFIVERLKIRREYINRDIIPENAMNISREFYGYVERKEESVYHNFDVQSIR